MAAEPDAFLRQYELATNTHDFDNVRPLIDPDAVYFFSNAYCRLSTMRREARQDGSRATLSNADTYR